MEGALVRSEARLLYVSSRGGRQSERSIGFNTPHPTNLSMPIDAISTVDIIPFMSQHDEIESLLPLQAATFHILMALADDDRHGYAIIQDIAERTRGELKLSAGTLYRSIQRMLEQGLITETRERPAPEDDDERRRYYRIRRLALLSPAPKPLA